ncbi:hypothetical protein [Azospirillum picis]|uniref:Uncharacterized protein n=1 Tax=Azospirillum picis TaxID=488438 RepID=A0ABU0MQ45_9PROT|nr:hypothetical protein [Azospirillum picis]MBP2301476.1 hypothetical protein [Azospirillum picis]MDQ0535308.1 hypothetical protein [Azospirillum picis]
MADMSVSVPNLSLSAFSQLKGTTDKVAPSGTNADYRNFTVSKAGEFNFKVNNNFTDVEIRNERNEVVTILHSKESSADASARLGPGNYTAVISQANRTAGVRDYSLDISEKQNILVTGAGATLKGTAQPPANGDTGVQKHTFNVLQGGTFTANLSLPNTRWAMMDKDGKVVAASDSSETDAQNDFLKKPTYKVPPGQYTMVLVPPSTLKSPTDFRFSFVPRDPSLTAAGTQESAIAKTLRERQTRLREWASQAPPTKTSA